MCGFAGIIHSQDPSKIKSRVIKMTDLLTHRGPDDFGYYNDSKVSFGFRRLSIIDLSKNGSQPMEIGSHTIVFNGEIYNYKKIRSELENLGQIFFSSSDTEVLLRGYICWGENILNKLRGMFAFIIWDQKNKKAFMARDHFGKKPFYYFLNEKEFIFCSEINPIKSVLKCNPKISESSLVSFLMRGYYQQKTSIYKNIFTLDAGESAVFDYFTFRLTTQSYWDKKFEISNKDLLNDNFVIEQIDQVLSKAVLRRHVSDVPIGLCLSGGVDSSLIALKSPHILPNKVKAFNLSFPNTNNDEFIYASMVAKKVNIDLEKIDQDQTDLNLILNNLVKCFGEPFGDDSAIPSFTLYNILKNHGKVFLSGDGGDEMFGGYIDSKYYLMQDNLTNLSGIANVFSDKFILKLVHSKSSKVKYIGYLLNMLQSKNNSFNILRTGGWSSHMYGVYGGNAVFKEKFIQEEKRDIENFINLGENNIERYMNKSLERLTQQYLVKTDRTSMYNSIEVRSPFLDVDVFEISRVLSQKNIFSKSTSKFILKEILKEKMGEKFVHRKKMGFSPPLNQWILNGKNQQWAKELLKNKSFIVKKYISNRAIDNLFKSQNQGRENSLRIWRLLFLNLWFKNIYLEI